MKLMPQSVVKYASPTRRHSELWNTDTLSQCSSFQDTRGHRQCPGQGCFSQSWTGIMPKEDAKTKTKAPWQPSHDREAAQRVIFKEYAEAWRSGSVAECLLCSLKELSLNPLYSHRKLDIAICVCDLRMGSRLRRVVWPASLAKAVSWLSVSHSLKAMIRRRMTERYQHLLRPLCMHARTLTYVHHMYTPTHKLMNTLLIKSCKSYASLNRSPSSHMQNQY